MVSDAAAGQQCTFKTYRCNTAGTILSMSSRVFRVVLGTCSPGEWYWLAIQPVHPTAQMLQIQYRFLFVQMEDCRLIKKHIYN